MDISIHNRTIPQYTFTLQVGIFLGSRVWTYFLYLCMSLYFFLYTVFDLVQVLVSGKLQPREVHPT